MAEQGTLTGKSNDGTTWTYTGDILNGKRHGKGKTTWPDGMVIEGDFVEDELHGKGKEIMPDGTVYEGDFVNGQPHGKGKCKLSDGYGYEGDFVKGKWHGKGKSINPDGSVAYEGDFVQGKWHGKGKTKFYEGDFVNGQPHGKGKYMFSDGCVYEGDMADGKPHGKGKKTYADGRVYEGDFNAGFSKDEMEKARQELLLLAEEEAKQKKQREKQERRKKRPKRIIGLMLTFVPFIVGLVLFYIAFKEFGKVGGFLSDHWIEDCINTLICSFIFLGIPLVLISFRILFIVPIIIFIIGLFFITFSYGDTGVNTWWVLPAMVVAFVMAIVYPKDKYWD